MNPRFPLYIPSKGRADSRITMRYLDAMGVPYYVVIEEPEYAAYAAVIPRDRLLVLDMQYKADYDTFDRLGDTKSKGAGPARNFAWDHAIAHGHAWHWVMDDNIKGFYRYHQNRKVTCEDGTPFVAMEDFCLRYENVAVAGPQYYMFCPRKKKFPPFVANTRIYSCNLIRNDIPFRWRGRYNEDTDLSLRVLKAGWCTIQFNAFLQQKLVTSIVKGGNTAEFYSREGTLPKSQMLVDMHPDVTRLTWKFGRWHHEIDYRVFKARNKLVRCDGVVIPDGNPYALQLITMPKE